MKSKMNQVLVPLAQGFEEVEAVTIIDLLRRGGVQVITASLTNERLVSGAHGIGVQADESLDDLKDQDFSAVVLPGGMPGTTNLASNRTLGLILQKHSGAGAWICAICAAPTVLAKHGILKGKRATSYPGFEAQLTGATFVEEAVVEDGKVITSRGPGTAIPFALKVLERLCGASTAVEVKKGLLAS